MYGFFFLVSEIFEAVLNSPESLISETGNETFKDKILLFLQTSVRFVETLKNEPQNFQLCS